MRQTLCCAGLFLAAVLAVQSQAQEKPPVDPDFHFVKPKPDPNIHYVKPVVRPGYHVVKPPPNPNFHYVKPAGNGGDGSGKSGKQALAEGK